MYQLNLTEEQLLIVEKYCQNEMSELKKICNPLIYRKGVPLMYHDDLYDVASDTLIESVMRYDKAKECSFKTFLTGNIHRAFYDWTRDQRRFKRCNVTEEIDEDGNPIKDKNGKQKYVVVTDVSFDAPIEDGFDIREKIASNFDIENELSKEMFLLDERTQNYINSLSKKQQKIAKLIMDGYKPIEIREQMNITEKEYNMALTVMKSHEKSKHLHRDMENNIVYITEDEDMETINTTTSEKTKNTSYAISAICKKLKKHQLRDDHVLQRKSGQWNTYFKSELMSDILQGKALTQIIISEEIKNGITMHWLIDGLQRCSNIEDFINDRFAISKNVQRYNINYQTDKKDDDGNILYNDEGFPIPEIKTFDIRKKKFSQLPEELRDKFSEYQVPVMLNLNCTKKEIAYDIARFNRCRPMNVAQNGWTGLEEGYAEFVDNILKMDFFNEDYANTDYRPSNDKSGMMRRMIVESIMAVNFLDDFNKDFGKMCRFLSNEGNDSTFIEFYSLVERLSAVANEEFFKVFSIKDSFLWFGLFDRFIKICDNDKSFADFVGEFNSTLHSKIIDGISFDALNEKSTKDKAIVIKKITHLEKLVLDFLHIEKRELEKYNRIEENLELSKTVNVLEFVKENVDVNVNSEDIELYKTSLNDYTVEIDEKSKEIVDKNLHSFIGLVAYAFNNDIDDEIPKWLVAYIEEYASDIEKQSQKENYLHMMQNFEGYLSKKGRVA